MSKEIQIKEVHDEAYRTAKRTGSRSAFTLVMDLYPEEAEVILSRLSVTLEATGHTKLSAGIDKLAKQI